MAELTHKAPGMRAVIDSLTGKATEGFIRHDVCVSCGQQATEFRDALSRKEYRISGLCQECQDSVFGNSEEE